MNNTYLQPIDYSLPTDINTLTAFETYLFKEGKSAATIKGILSCLKRLIRDVTPLTDNKLNEYLLAQFKQGKAGSYINSYISAIRNYGHFLGIDDFNNIKFFKIKESLKSTMSDNEIEAFLTIPPRDGCHGVFLRNFYMMKVFWTLLAFTGARTGEIASLTVDDVDFGRQILVVNGKTGQRNVPINSILTDVLKNHLRLIKGKYLFPSMRTNRILERSAWHFDFKQRLKKLGIKRVGLTPYSLRHSFITRMLEEDINIFKIQKIVGHKKIETTAIYTHMTTKDMVNAIQKDPLSRQNLTIDQRISLGKEALEKAGFVIVESRDNGDVIRYEVKK